MWMIGALSVTVTSLFGESFSFGRVDHCQAEDVVARRGMDVNVMALIIIVCLKTCGLIL